MYSIRTTREHTLLFGICQKFFVHECFEVYHIYDLCVSPSRTTTPLVITFLIAEVDHILGFLGFLCSCYYCFFCFFVCNVFARAPLLGLWRCWYLAGNGYYRGWYLAADCWCTRLCLAQKGWRQRMRLGLTSLQVVGVRWGSTQQQVKFSSRGHFQTRDMPLGVAKERIVEFHAIRPVLGFIKRLWIRNATCHPQSMQMLLPCLKVTQIHCLLFTNWTKAKIDEQWLQIAMFTVLNRRSLRFSYNRLAYTTDSGSKQWRKWL